MAAGSYSTNIPCKDEHDFQTPLVFIIGSGRSGSTLLKNILDRHPEIAVVTEFQFFKQIYSRRKKHDDFSRSETREFLAAEQARLLTKTEYPNNESDLDAQQLKKKLTSATDYCDLFCRASELVASQETYEVIVHNTPSDGFFLPQLFSLFPQARVLHLVRDGREVVASAAKRGWGYHPFDQISQWQETLRYYDTYGERNPDKRNQMQEHTYENLVNNPRETLTQILDFIPAVGDAPDNFYDFSEFGYSNSSFGTDREGLYHSRNFTDFFSREDQQKVTALMADELRDRNYNVFNTNFYPLLEIWNTYRRYKFRVFIEARRAGYAHTYDALRRFFNR